eukprot:SAG31_NODE_46048_length_256_cov_0.656051_1_plen_63_part_01
MVQVPRIWGDRQPKTLAKTAREIRKVKRQNDRASTFFAGAEAAVFEGAARSNLPDESAAEYAR